MNDRIGDDCGDVPPPIGQMPEWLRLKLQSRDDAKKCALQNVEHIDVSNFPEISRLFEVILSFLNKKRAAFDLPPLNTSFADVRMVTPAVYQSELIVKHQLVSEGSSGVIEVLNRFAFVPVDIEMYSAHGWYQFGVTYSVLHEMCHLAMEGCGVGGLYENDLYFVLNEAVADSLAREFICLNQGLFMSDREAALLDQVKFANPDGIYFCESSGVLVHFSRWIEMCILEELGSKYPGYKEEVFEAAFSGKRESIKEYSRSILPEEVLSALYNTNLSLSDKLKVVIACRVDS